MELPLQIVVTPTKTTYQLDEPIVVNITITNQSQEAQIVDLARGVTALCQNYRGQQQLEPLAHLHDLTPYDLPQANGTRMIEPEEVVTFTVTSAYMVKPGEYQLLFYMRYTYSPSEITALTVAPPADDDARHAALAKWINIADPNQRPVIAQELIEKFDDPQGIDVILALMKGNTWRPKYPQPLFGCQLAWQYGGQAGADIMTEKIQSMTSFDLVRRALDYGIALSPHRVESLAKLLACETLTRYAPINWVEKPRVRDVVAHWLAGYSDELTFPIDGTEAARDEAIAAIAAQLQKDPAAFTVLQDDPADQQPKDTPPPDD